MTEMTFQFSIYQVAANNTSCFMIHHYHIQHFVAGIHGYITEGHLTFEGLVSTNQQLLTGLTGCIESPFYLGTTKRSVI